MHIKSLDHLVLTVNSINDTVDFYCHILGMEKIVLAENRVALLFGSQKINLHERGKEFEPKAQYVRTGSADLCFIVETPLTSVIAELNHKQVKIIDGPVMRTGAQGAIESVYLYDPDGNLIELSNYIEPSAR